MNASSDRFTLSMEAMAYHRESPLYRGLKLICEDMIIPPPATPSGAPEEPSATASPYASASALIKRLTNLDLHFEIIDSPHANAYVLMNHLSHNHVLFPISAYIADVVGKKVDLTSLSAKLHNKVGGVDSTGAITGVLKDLPVTLYITTELLYKDRFTAEEVAAIILHEIGHVYSCMEMLSFTTITSVLVSQIEATLAATSDIKERQGIVEEGAKVLYIGDIDAADLAKLENAKTVPYVFISTVIRNVDSDVKGPHLFDLEREYAADAYAIRSGAAKPLTTALVKIFKISPTYRSISSHVPEGIKNLNRLTGVILGGMTVWGALAAPAWALSAFIGLLLAYLGTRTRSIEVETPIERLEAMHADIVNKLKDVSVPTQFKEELVETLTFISAAREQLVERRALITAIGVFIYDHPRSAAADLKLQQDLIKTINNDLFVSAAKLSLLTSAKK